MGDSSIKSSRIKVLKSHAHLHITGRKPTKFQVNLMKNVGRVAETRSLGRTAERTEGRAEERTDGRAHTRTDESNFFSPLRLRRVTIIPACECTVYQEASTHLRMSNSFSDLQGIFCLVCVVRTCAQTGLK